MGLKNNPCRNCTERVAGCHVWCPKGLQADREWQKEKARIEQNKKQESDANGTLIELKEAIKKGKR